jgi:hypothetical protein
VAKEFPVIPEKEKDRINTKPKCYLLKKKVPKSLNSFSFRILLCTDAPTEWSLKQPRSNYKPTQKSFH